MFIYGYFRQLVSQSVCEFVQSTLSPIFIFYRVYTHTHYAHLCLSTHRVRTNVQRNTKSQLHFRILRINCCCLDICRLLYTSKLRFIYDIMLSDVKCFYAHQPSTNMKCILLNLSLDGFVYCIIVIKSMLKWLVLVEFGALSGNGKCELNWSIIK